MDPAPLQQTVMEPQQPASVPQEADSTLSAPLAAAPPPADTQPPSSPKADQAYEPLSYDEVSPRWDKLNKCSYITVS